MKKKRYSDEQIVRILREATIYIWRKKFVGMQADEVKRLKALEAENTRLRKLLVDRELEIDVMKEINAKKW